MSMTTASRQAVRYSATASRALDLPEPGPPMNTALVRRKFINSGCCDSSTPRSARSWQGADLGAR